MSAMFGYSESIATRTSMTASIRQSVENATYSKPTLKITLKDPEKKIYYTGDMIEGKVSFMTQSDTRFDEISIKLEGISRTWIEKFGGPSVGRQSIAHTVSPNGNINEEKHKTPSKIPFLTKNQFLGLIQPIDEELLPIPRVASAGQAITIPFTFAIPDRLLPTSCTHDTAHGSIHALHTQVPPSFGDNSSPSTCYEDQAPDMTQILYRIFVTVSRSPENTTLTKPAVIISTFHKLHVRPTYEEQPPQHLPPDTNTPDFSLHREKFIRRGLLNPKKLGRLSITAPEPKPLRLSATVPSSTIIPIELTFTPTDKTSIPPTLGSVTTKLRTSTFFSTTRTEYIPNSSRATADTEIGHYSESTLLSSRCMSNTRWTPTTSSSGETIYKAHLSIPVMEPKCKNLIPSFSTCFITRSYRLQVEVTVQTGNHSTTGVTLKLPLQVCRPSKKFEVGLEGEEQHEVDEFFTPRTVGPPPEFDASREEVRRRLMERRDSGMAPVTRSISAATVVASPSPPGYSDFGRASRVPVRIPTPPGISPGCG